MEANLLLSRQSQMALEYIVVQSPFSIHLTTYSAIVDIISSRPLAAYQYQQSYTSLDDHNHQTINTHSHTQDEPQRRHVT
jgi:hypothetical protein